MSDPHLSTEGSDVPPAHPARHAAVVLDSGAVRGRASWFGVGAREPQLGRYTVLAAVVLVVVTALVIAWSTAPLFAAPEGPLWEGRETASAHRAEAVSHTMPAVPAVLTLRQPLRCPLDL